MDDHTELLRLREQIADLIETWELDDTDATDDSPKARGIRAGIYDLLQPQLRAMRRTRHERSLE
jgi:hypothetical protein